MQIIVFVFSLFGYMLLTFSVVSLIIWQIPFLFWAPRDWDADRLHAVVQLALAEAVTAAVCLWAAAQL